MITDWVLAADTVWTIAADHILSFGIGCAVGFLLTNRYRIIKRHDENDGNDDGI